MEPSNLPISDYSLDNAVIITANLLTNRTLGVLISEIFHLTYKTYHFTIVLAEIQKTEGKMKFSTRARYGLRMMIEFARELKKDNIVHLGRIAGITGLSENYLAQLTSPLKGAGLLIGVSGKKGGYMLGRPADQISIGEIVQALVGPIGATDCVNSPDICMNSTFCEARIVWTLASARMLEVFDSFTLADMVDRDKIRTIAKENEHIPLIDPDRVLESWTLKDA